jgi:transglutaminase-like putative cysteine protease
MATRVGLHHTTEYRFDRPVGLSPHVIRLRPAAHCRTPILSYALRVEPANHFVNWQQDPFGNFLARFVFPEKVSRLAIEVDLIAEMTVINPFDFFLETGFETIPFRYDEATARDLAPYLEVVERGPRLPKWLEGVDRRPAATVDFLVALNQRLQGEDHFGNPVVYFALQEPHWSLEVVATACVTVEAPAPDLSASIAWDALRTRLLADASPASLEARELLLDSPMVPLGPELAAYAAPSFPPGRPLLEAVHDFNRRLHREFVYEPNFTTVTTPVLEVLANRRGVCQDFAHVAIGCLRSLGVPARYVSGYIESVPPPGQAPVRGAGASHAWLAVYDPNLGWVDFDPTNDQIVGEQHVTVAWGRDYGDVTPLKGVVFGGGAHTLDVAVELKRIE